MADSPADYAQIMAGLSERLGADDNANLWNVVVRRVLKPLENLPAGKRRIYMKIGACSHWIRPHWKKLRRGPERRGWALPLGYDPTTTLWSAAMPRFDWSLIWERVGTKWTEAECIQPRSFTLRVTVPARTVRHVEAAIHTVWLPRNPGDLDKEKPVVVYGFIRQGRSWRMIGSELLRPRKRRGSRFKRVAWPQH